MHAIGTILALAALSLLAPQPANAQAGAACVVQSPLAEHQNACAIQSFQAIDARQNILYGDVMRALASHERPLLRKDQTTWSRQRTAACKALHAPQEALSHWPALYYQCLSTHTQARHVQLLHWLHHGQAPHAPQ